MTFFSIISDLPELEQKSIQNGQRRLKFELPITDHKPSFNFFFRFNLCHYQISDLILFVFYRSKQFLQVSWIRLRDFYLLTVGNYIYTSDSRFSVRQLSNNDWTLQILRLTTHDQGKCFHEFWYRYLKTGGYKTEDSSVKSLPKPANRP